MIFVFIAITLGLSVVTVKEPKVPSQSTQRIYESGTANRAR